MGQNLARPKFFREPRPCDGWPELGLCDEQALAHKRYCRECDDLRKAHAGIREPEPEEDDE